MKEFTNKWKFPEFQISDFLVHASKLIIECSTTKELAIKYSLTAIPTFNFDLAKSKDNGNILETGGLICIVIYSVFPASKKAGDLITVLGNFVSNGGKECTPEVIIENRKAVVFRHTRWKIVFESPVCTGRKWVPIDIKIGNQAWKSFAGIILLLHVKIHMKWHILYPIHQ